VLDDQHGLTRGYSVEKIKQLVPAIAPSATVQGDRSDTQGTTSPAFALAVPNHFAMEESEEVPAHWIGLSAWCRRSAQAERISGSDQPSID
jgi:hypothetical protein